MYISHENVSHLLCTDIIAAIIQAVIVHRASAPEALPGRVPQSENNFSGGLTSELTIAISYNCIMVHNNLL